MRRPLMRLNINQLEGVFKDAKTSVRGLRGLEDELKHRNVPRAITLLNEVRKALKELESETRPPLTLEPVEVPTQEPKRVTLDLFSEFEKSQHRTPQSPAMVLKPIERETQAQPSHGIVSPTVSNTAPPTSIGEETEILPKICVEDAYKLLKATSSSSWESIEMSRRQCVEKARPDLVTTLNEENRKMIQDEARRINAAYAIILEDRMQRAMKLN